MAVNGYCVMIVSYFFVMAVHCYCVMAVNAKLLLSKGLRVVGALRL
jgi:hypothetical protein